MTDQRQTLGRKDVVRPSKLPTIISCPGAMSLLIGAEKKSAGAAAEEGSRLHQISYKVSNEAYKQQDWSSELCWEVAEKLGATRQEFDEVIFPWISYAASLVSIDHYTEYEVKFQDNELHIGGTCDFIGVRPKSSGLGTRIFIADLKTGRGIPVEAEGNAQLRAYAALAYKAGLATEGDELDPETTFELSIFQPRSMHGRKVSVEILTMSDILEFRRELKGMLVAYQAATPEEREEMLNPGTQCRYCEAVMGCPAASAKLGEFLSQATPNAIREADPVILEQFCSDYETSKSIFGAIGDNLVAAIEEKPVEGWTIAERQGLKSWDAEKIIDVFSFLKNKGIEEGDANLYFTPAMPISPSKLRTANKAAYDLLAPDMHQGEPSRSVKRVKA